MNPTPPKPCQFTVAVGGVVCGAAPTWRNEDEIHGNCFFCQPHKEILAADETYGGDWFELQPSSFIIQPS